jgi:hypothetical protein
MESMRSQISTSIQKIDLIYQILIQIGESLSSSKTLAPENRLHHNTYINIDRQNFNDDRAASILQGEDLSELSIANANDRPIDDSRRLHQNPVGYPNNGYANLPSGANYRYDTAEWVIAGQDLSIDNNGTNIVSATAQFEDRQQIREQDLSPQIQIQRLTAQLTAAYNRIAALEEQLLSKRRKQ